MIWILANKHKYNLNVTRNFIVNFLHIIVIKAHARYIQVLNEILLNLIIWKLKNIITN